MANSSISKKVWHCKIIGCTATRHQGRGYCSTHYYRVVKFGDPFKTSRGPNGFEKVPEGYLIHLCDKHGNLKAKTLIDADDLERVIAIRWHMSDKYAQSSRPEIKLHHFILDNIPKGYEVDHVNRDKLDNRKSNLRLATRGQNARNMELPLGRVRFRGVRWHKRNKKFESRIEYRGKRFHLGYFKIAEDAAKAYNRKAAELHGNFAVLNSI